MMRINKYSFFAFLFMLIGLGACELQKGEPYHPDPMEKWNESQNALEYLRKAKGFVVYKTTADEMVRDTMPFSIYLNLLKKFELEQLLSDNKNYTYLVPTNAAFFRFMTDFNSHWDWDKNDWKYKSIDDFPDSLQEQIIKSHILTTVVRPKDIYPLYRAVNYKNLLGVNVTLTQDDQERLVLRSTPPPLQWQIDEGIKPEPQYNTPRTHNVKTANGVIHTIDRFYIDQDMFMGLGSQYQE